MFKQISMSGISWTFILWILIIVPINVFGLTLLESYFELPGHWLRPSARWHCNSSDYNYKTSMCVFFQTSFLHSSQLSFSAIMLLYNHHIVGGKANWGNAEKPNFTGHTKTIMTLFQINLFVLIFLIVRLYVS